MSQDVGIADHQKGGKQGRDDHVKYLSTQIPLQRSFSVFAKCISTRIWIEDLNRGSKLRIYSHKVCMYVHTWWVTLRMSHGMSLQSTAHLQHETAPLTQ